MSTADNLAVVNKKPLHVDDKQETFPQLVYDPIRGDVQKYLQEKAPALSLSVEDVSVRRLPDDTGYGGIFIAGPKAYWYVMTGKGFQYKQARDYDKAQETFGNLMQREQAMSRLVRQQESKKDLELVIDLGKSTRRERALFQKERAAFVCVVEKALPHPKEEKVKQAKPTGKASAKKQGAGANKVRYDYPNEKGKPGAAPKAKAKKPGQAQEQQKEKKPREQVGGSKPQPQPDPIQQEYVDPSKLARVLHIDPAALRKLATKFQSSPKMDGRKGFISFMLGKLKQFSAKHNLDTKYFGLVYDALVSTTSGPAPRDSKES
jgi:hypothetical protein